jgi:hypothetical protein
MTVLPWRRSRAEQLARALHPSAGSARSRAAISIPVGADSVHHPGRDRDEEPSRAVETTAEPLVRLCSDARCRRYLRTSTEGRLSYSTGRGPVTLVVPYILSGLGSLLIPVAPFNEARQYVPGRQVTLEVSGSSPEFDHWVVRVTGIASQKLILGTDDAASCRRLAEDGPPVPLLDSGELAVLELPLTHVRGFGTMASVSPRTEGVTAR